MSNKTGVFQYVITRLLLGFSDIWQLFIECLLCARGPSLVLKAQPLNGKLPFARWKAVCICNMAQNAVIIKYLIVWGRGKSHCKGAWRVVWRSYQPKAGRPVYREAGTPVEIVIKSVTSQLAGLSRVEESLGARGVEQSMESFMLLDQTIVSSCLLVFCCRKSVMSCV